MIYSSLGSFTPRRSQDQRYISPVKPPSFRPLKTFPVKVSPPLSGSLWTYSFRPWRVAVWWLLNIEAPATPMAGRPMYHSDCVSLSPSTKMAQPAFFISGSRHSP